MPTDDDDRPDHRSDERPDSGPDRGAYVVDTRNRFRRQRGDQPPSPLKPSGHQYGVRTAAPPETGQDAPAGIDADADIAPTREWDVRDMRGGAPRPPATPPPVPTHTEVAPRRRRHPVRNTLLVVLVLVLAWVAFMVWVPVNAWNHVARVDATPAGQRPAENGGSNFLLVGSDSREGLTEAQKQALNGEGDAAGKRTDSIILVHVPASGGKSVLLSIPRDSYVPIPGHGSNKINAAYAFGGPKLLAQTIEQNTGIHVDGYLEIGFAGFAGVVDSLGGVDVCVPFDMNDPDAAVNLKKGCQTLDGPTALGYVRARKSDPRGDIGRAERQRQFLGALLKKAVQPSTVLIPWRYKTFADSASSGLTVGDTTSFGDAVKTLQALRGVDGGDTLSLVVPIQTASLQTPAGVAIKWNATQAKALFDAIQQDQPLTSPPAGTTGT